MAWGDLVDTLRQGRLPVALWSWDYDNGDAGSFLRDVVHTRDETRGLGAFNPGFSNHEADRLITAATAAFEPTARRAIYGKLMRLVREEASLIPLFHPPHVYAAGPALEFAPRLDDRFLVAEMSWAEGPGSR
jgi:peptide/nickel transport system substrate-binding protein